jgi:hypothetical protein
MRKDRPLSEYKQKHKTFMNKTSYRMDRNKLLADDGGNIDYEAVKTVY